LLLGVGDVLTALTVQLGSMVAVDVVPNSRGGRGWLTSVHVGSERGSESSRGGERGSGRPCANAGVVSSSKIQPKNPAGAKSEHGAVLFNTADTGDVSTFPARRNRKQFHS
jgi:hypothetical protein